MELVQDSVYWFLQSFWNEGYKIIVSSKYNVAYKMKVSTKYTRVGTLIVATIYLQLIQNRYMFRSFTVLQCSHQHCVQPFPAMWKS